MAIAAIYVLILAALSLLYLGFWKEDYWLIILSSMILIAVGLTTIISGIEDIVNPTYRWIFGIIILFIGLYLGSRASMEALTEKGV